MALDPQVKEILPVYSDLDDVLRRIVESFRWADETSA
jgi:hypothetical protein